MMREQRPGDVLRGFGLAVLLHLVFQAGAYFLLMMSVGDEQYGEISALLGVFAIGLSQLAYLGPTWLLLRNRRRDAMAKGVAIVMALTFLLNAGCWGTLYIAA